MKRKLIKAAMQILGTVAVVVCAAWMAIAQPSCRRNRPSTATVDPVKLREHVEILSQRFHPRDWQHRDHLDRCADYIAQQFGQAGAAVEFQPFTAGGHPYRNVIGRFPAGQGPCVVVGAHYDACGEMPGADDNASGIAALIELAHLLGRQAPTSAVELVAYVLEEPPFFRTEYMGSALHAKSLAGDQARVRGVIVLEMVGCFKDERGSQSFPMLLLRLMYPSRANFIAVASRWDQGDWIKKVKAGMQGATDLPVYSIRAPAVLPGIDFSDHLNYWPYGFKALMVTDTAFYRNKAYHSPADTPDKLDYHRMAKVVVAVFGAIGSL
ncbi:MAG: M28 family peptidase [Kiritimatiellaeota bacterium]|nr:M28 family peptidase [Kiritimatiellota bacterium]